MTDFGTATIDGITYTLTGQAELSNRVFPNWWGDAKEGESYISEWEAPGVDADGNDVIVRWQFDEIKGSETEPDSLDWDSPYSVREV